MLMSTLCYYEQVIIVYDDPAEEQLTLSSRGRPVEVGTWYMYIYMYILCTCTCNYMYVRVNVSIVQSEPHIHVHVNHTYEKIAVLIASLMLYTTLRSLSYKFWYNALCTFGVVYSFESHFFILCYGEKIVKTHIRCVRYQRKVGQPSIFP